MTTVVVDDDKDDKDDDNNDNLTCIARAMAAKSLSVAGAARRGARRFVPWPFRTRRFVPGIS